MGRALLAARPRALGRLIADFLAPGGIFYIAEFHPFLFALADDSEEPLVSRDAYFHRAEAHA